jgi:hypothetical protein
LFHFLYLIICFGLGGARQKAEGSKQKAQKGERANGRKGERAKGRNDLKI